MARAEIAESAEPDEPVQLAELVSSEGFDWTDRNTFFGLTNATAIAIIGVVTVVLGFVLIVIGWAEVARENQVYRQLPYIASADVAGLAFVIVGTAIVNIGAKRRDAEDEDTRLDRLTELVERLENSTPRRGRR